MMVPCWSAVQITTNYGTAFVTTLLCAAVVRAHAKFQWKR